MSTDALYGELLSIPISIKDNNGDHEIYVYNPKKETPKFIELLDIVKIWVLEEFDMNDIIPAVSKIMTIVNQAVSSPHSGEYKKKLVLSLIYSCVKYSSMLLPDKNIAYTIISIVAPSAIDTMVSIAKGKLDIKKTAHYVEKNCLSMFETTIKKNTTELSNTIYEHRKIN